MQTIVFCADDNDRVPIVRCTKIEVPLSQVIALDSIEQRIIQLRIYAGFSHRQISISTGLSERSVKRVLDDVIAKIKMPRVRPREV